MNEVVEYSVVTIKQKKESSMHLEKSSADFGTMDKLVEYAAVTDQRNK